MEEIKEYLEKVKTNMQASGRWLIKCSMCGQEKEVTEMVGNNLCHLCNIKEKAHRHLLATIPKKFQGIDTDKDISEYSGKNLFICGKSGTGKTLFTCSILKKYIDKTAKGAFINYPYLIMRLQDMYRREDKSPFEYAEHIAKLNCLIVLDDLGAEKLTDYVRQITYFIINEREQRELPIIITSNFSLDTIANQIDIRIASRIAGMCEVLKFQGEDRRLKGDNSKFKDK